MNLRLLILLLLLQTNIAFAAMQDGHWHVGIGDPTVFGWLTVLAYLVAVWRCWVWVFGRWARLLYVCSRR